MIDEDIQKVDKAAEPDENFFNFENQPEDDEIKSDTTKDVKLLVNVHEYQPVIMEIINPEPKDIDKQLSRSVFSANRKRDNERSEAKNKRDLDKRRSLIDKELVSL